VTAELVPVSDGDIAETEQYQALLADCREITEGARIAVLKYMWLLGERINRDYPADDEGTYGRKITEALERDLVIDRTTLIRARQTYQRFPKNEIGDGSSPMLTWGKLRMLLPLEEPFFSQIKQRIYAGELRTDEDVRRAIDRLLDDAGKRKALPSGSARHQLHLAGFDEEIVRKPLSTLWNKFDSVGRAMLVTALIPSLGLDDADRPQALELIRAMRRQVDEVETHLGEGEGAE